jgi:hypothetical protein
MGSPATSPGPTLTTRHVLEREQIVPRPRAEVFAFFSDAHNLEAITPAFLRFRITTPGRIPMGPGATIDYRLSLFGIPFRWRSIIEVFEPMERFVDVQVRGPYRSWRHLHEFSDVAGGTRVRDRVEYELPAGPLGALAHGLLVRRSLDRIFDHRARAIGAMLAPSRPPASRAAAAAGP